MAEGTNVTTDRNEIRSWVEERGGFPARVKDTGEPGVLRIDYPGYTGDETLERMDWDEWFKAFDDSNLAFLYQDQTKDGKTSRFSKLIDRDSADEKASAAGRK